MVFRCALRDAGCLQADPLRLDPVAFPFRFPRLRTGLVTGHRSCQPNYEHYENEFAPFGHGRLPVQFIEYDCTRYQKAGNPVRES